MTALLLLLAVPLTGLYISLNVAIIHLLRAAVRRLRPPAATPTALG